MSETHSSTPSSDPDDDAIWDEVMCSCSGTTRRQIYIMHEAGLDIDAISRKTGALSGCGGCEWDIGEFIKLLQSQEND